MKESVIYQAIVEEGRAEGALDEARKILLRMGEEHFGTAPSASFRKRIEATQNLDQLEQLTLRVPRLRSWDELFSEQSKKAHRKRPRR